MHMRRTLSLPLIALALLASQAAAGRQADFRKVVGSTECSACHETEAEILSRTRHSRTLDELRDRPAAIEIAHRLGLADPLSEGLCQDCHLTTALIDGERRIIEGIACESCHGGGRSFLLDHPKDKNDAPKEWARIESIGMVTPARLYELATRCYSCHLVSSEKLVDIGGHTVGSPFELLSWSQGEIRHNTWYTKGESNIERGRDGCRLLYLLGSTVELEAVLRAAAEIEGRGRYYKAVSRRLVSARHRMEKISKACPDLPLRALLDTVGGLRIGRENGQALTPPAEQLSEIGRHLLERYDGTELSCLDALVPNPEEYRGSSYEPGH